MYLVFFILVIALVITIIYWNQNEHMTELSNESIQALSSVYNSNNLTVTNATVTGSFNLLPRGSIIMWYGSTVPNGWTICDGSNGTPDLRGRFVVGTGQGPGLSNRTMGDKGGEENHILTINEIPAHSHPYFDSFWIENYPFFRDNFGHNVQQNNNFGGNLFGNGGSYDGDNNVIGYNTNTSNTGGGGSHNNMPPYYALVFIMKT